MARRLGVFVIFKIRNDVLIILGLIAIHAKIERGDVDKKNIINFFLKLLIHNKLNHQFEERVIDVITFFEQKRNRGNFSAVDDCFSLTSSTTGE